MLNIVGQTILNRGSPFINTQESLEGLIKKSQSVLLRISSVFPFDFFPDSLIIDENKVSIIKRDFLTEDVHSILIEDITNISVNRGLFFATLSITDCNNPRFPKTYSLHYLKQAEAFCARRIIQGIVEAKREGLVIMPQNCARFAHDIENVGKTLGE